MRRKDLRKKELWKYCHTDENSDRVGETTGSRTNLDLSK